MSLSTKLRPTATLPEVAQEMIDVIPLVQQKIVVVQGFTIGTAETLVAHGLGTVPLMAYVLPHTNVAVWRNRAPDSKFVYLIAASSVICDVAVIV